MVQELLDLQKILQHEDYKVCEISYMQMSAQCKKFGTKFTIEFLRGDGIKWDKDTYILTSSDDFQSVYLNTKEEVMNLMFFVYHCIAK